MLELRFHGRGGQGAVTSTELLAKAAIEQGHFAQSFPSFGPERRGAPVAAFVRVAENQIRVRDKVYYPDITVVLDSTLLDVVNVAEGLKPGGLVVVNSSLSPAELKQKYSWPKVAQVNADKIALEELGLVITNTTMLGAVIKASGIVSVEAMEAVIMDRFGPKLGPKNFAALKRAFKETVIA